MKLSIIIPAYNAAPYLEQCISSLLRQDLPKKEYEIIVVNDGSTDNTLEVLEHMKVENMTVISQKNQKQGTARNNGVKIAKGKYIMYYDADDYVDDNCLGWITEELEYNDLDVLFAQCPPQMYSSAEIKDGWYFLRCGVMYISPKLYILKKSFIQEHHLDFIDGVVYEDNEYIPRIYIHAKRMKIDTRHFHNYVLSPNSTTRSTYVKSFVLNGFVYKLFPSMKADCDLMYKNDTMAAGTLYDLFCGTFHMFIRKLCISSPQKRQLAIQQIAPYIKEYTKCFFRARKIRFRFEGIFLYFFPLNYYIALFLYLYKIKE